jgi:toxin ParE1/3/4
LSYRVYVRRTAERDIVEAQHWYEAQQQGLAAEFHAEFSAALGRLAETPLIYPVLYREVRRAVLHRFPYLIWFRVRNSDVTVIACTHGRVGPGWLSARLRGK